MSEPFNPTALQQLAQLRGMPPEEAALAVAIPEDTVLVLDVHAGEVTDGRIVDWHSPREMADDESPAALTGDDLFFLSGARYEETYDPIEEVDRRELVFLQDTPPDQYLVRASGNDPDRARSVASLIGGETGRPAIPLAETDASRAATSALTAGEMYEAERRREAMSEGYRTGRVEALHRVRDLGDAYGPDTWRALEREGCRATAAVRNDHLRRAFTVPTTPERIGAEMRKLTAAPWDQGPVRQRQLRDLEHASGVTVAALPDPLTVSQADHVRQVADQVTYMSDDDRVSRVAIAGPAPRQATREYLAQATQSLQRLVGRPAAKPAESLGAVRPEAPQAMGPRLGH
jgi:hypothetical protein